MKKIVMTAALVACAAVVTAQTVTSANIVGYSKTTVTGGELSLIALNFDTATTLQDAIGSSVPGLSVAYKWDKVAGAYAVATLSGRGSWGPNLALEIGDAFFLAPSGTDSHEILLSGEVLAEDSVLEIPAGIIATGYGFPVVTPWQSTELSADLPGLSVLYAWDDAGQAYDVVTKSGRGAWSANPDIGVSEGFFVNNAEEAFTSTNTVPYGE